MVLAAVTDDGIALRFASEELQGNRALVLAAVTQNGIALRFASEELQAEIKAYPGGVLELLKHYENVPINMVTLGGNKYILPNIHEFASINVIIEEEHFYITDLETSTRITSISQLRKYIFKFEIHEEPECFLVWTPEDE